MYEGWIFLLFSLSLSLSLSLSWRENVQASMWTHDGKSTNSRLMSYHGLSHIHTSHVTIWAMSLLVKRNVYLEVVEFKFNISHYQFIGYSLLRMSCGLRLRLLFFLKQNIMDETPISHILICMCVCVCNKCVFIIKLMWLFLSQRLDRFLQVRMHIFNG